MACNYFGSDITYSFHWISIPKAWEHLSESENIYKALQNIHSPLSIFSQPFGNIYETL